MVQYYNTIPTTYYSLLSPFCRHRRLTLPPLKSSCYFIGQRGTAARPGGRPCLRIAVARAQALPKNAWRYRCDCNWDASEFRIQPPPTSTSTSTSTSRHTTYFMSCVAGGRGAGSCSTGDTQQSATSERVKIWTRLAPLLLLLLLSSAPEQKPPRSEWRSARRCRWRGRQGGRRRGVGVQQFSSWEESPSLGERADRDRGRGEPTKSRPLGRGGRPTPSFEPSRHGIVFSH